MKRFLSCLISLMLMPMTALAMQQANTPPKFPVVWGASAATPYIRSIPQVSQIGIINCAASLPDGFPPLTFVPASAGGCPPFGQDFNGILKQITQWSQWYSAGSPIYYDATFATGAANGYPNGAVVQSTIVPGDFWLSTTDNNTSNPDAGGANWVPLPSSYQTGSVSWTWTTVPSGWVNATAGTTIGNASSGATLASSTTQLLYVLLWNNCSNSQCPVTGGRGANAAADYGSNKPIQVINMSGSMLIGNDQGTNILAGLPVISGLGPNNNLSIVGEVFHTLTTAQLPAHTHNYSGSGTTGSENLSHSHAETAFMTSSGVTAAASGGPAFLGANTGGQSTGPESANHQHGFSWSGTTDAGTGGGGAANNTSRSVVGLWMLKL
jgi:hypothetical protein